MGNMAEARRKMHERDERVKKENKSEVKKIRNFATIRKAKRSRNTNNI